MAFPYNPPSQALGNMLTAVSPQPQSKPAPTVSPDIEKMSQEAVDAARAAVALLAPKVGAGESQWGIPKRHELLARAFVAEVNRHWEVIYDEAVESRTCRDFAKTLTRRLHGVDNTIVSTAVSAPGWQTHTTLRMNKTDKSPESPASFPQILHLLNSAKPVWVMYAEIVGTQCPGKDWYGLYESWKEPKSDPVELLKIMQMQGLVNPSYMTSGFMQAYQLSMAEQQQYAALKLKAAQEIYEKQYVQTLGQLGNPLGKAKV